MRTIVTALAAATRATLSLTLAILALWVGVLLVSRVLVLPWEDAFESFFSSAPDARLWLTDWHARIADEFFVVEAERVRLGVDLVRRASLPWLIAWTFLAGGLVAVVAPTEEPQGFWSSCGRYAHRSFWLLVMTLAALAALGFVGAQLDAALTRAGWLDPTRSTAWIRTVLVGKTLLMSLAAAFILFTHRLARIRTVMLGERFAPATWVRAARAALAHLPATALASVLGTLPIAAVAYGMWTTLPALLEGESSGWFVLRTHVWVVPLIAAIVFRTALEAQLWPLFETTWTRAKPRAAQGATAAAVLVGVSAALGATLEDSAPRHVLLDVLDDRVVAHHQLAFGIQGATTPDTIDLIVDATAEVVSVSESGATLDQRPSNAPPARGEPLAFTHKETRLTVALPDSARESRSFALDIRLSAPRDVRGVGHAEVLPLVDVAIAESSTLHARWASSGRARVVVWSPENVVVEATGIAGVVGTDGDGHARATFELTDAGPLGAVALAGARSVSTTWTTPDKRPLVITLVGHEAVLRRQRASIVAGVQRALTELTAIGRSYPHAGLTVVLDPTPDALNAVTTTWCVVPVDLLSPTPRWPAPLADALARMTGEVDARITARLVPHLMEPTLPPSTRAGIQHLITHAAASGHWTLRVPWLGRPAGLLDVVGWWRSPYQPQALDHATPFGQLLDVDRALDDLRTSSADAWLAPVTMDNAAVTSARTEPVTDAGQRWRHTIDATRTSDSKLTPRLSLFFADGSQRVANWPENDDEWSLTLETSAPLITASLDQADARRHDDARLATPDHEPARALTGLATWWTQLSLWSWAAAL